MALGATAVAQVPRTNFVFHVYVDPMFGDDTNATTLNPGGTGTTVPPLGSHPFIDPITQIRLIEGALQHAPYPFRTLSGTQGALSYLDAVFPILPWSTSQGRTVSHVVIHCLPGLYGPTTVGGVPTPIDPGSGLPFNGESLPIRIERDRVCLQGTSALDTIFDARGAGLSILEIGSASTPPDGFRQTFIDSIAFRGARFNLEILPDPQTGRPRSNLQTFLFIFPGELPAQGPWDPSSTSDLPPREMDARIQEQEIGR